MTVWAHLTTTFKRRLVLLLAGLLVLSVALTTTLFFAMRAHAAPGINETLSFQGRLSKASGGVVPDGYYNIQFKIYQDGSGSAAGNPDGTLKWTETYVNNNANAGVQVKNGLFSVNLGSQNPFGTSVDWNQDTIWLSMNVAGSDAACTSYGSAPCASDGEMLPMKRMTATPFALNTARLGGITAAGFIQNTTTPQTADLNITGGATVGSLLSGGNITTSTGAFQVGTDAGITQTCASDEVVKSAIIKGGIVVGATCSSVSSGTAVELQGGTPGTAQTGNLNITGTGIFGTSVYSAAFDAAIADSDLSIGNLNATSISMATNSASQSVNIATGNGNKTLTLGSKYVSSSTLLQGGTGGVRIEANGDFAIQTLDTTRDALVVSNVGDIQMNLSTNKQFKIKNSANNDLFFASDDGTVGTGAGTNLAIQGSATFYKGITINTNYTGLQYTTPNGYDMSTMINIPNYTVSDYSTIMAFGLPSTSSATARGLLVADARASSHQATIGILSPNEGAIFGLSYNGSNTKASLSNTASSIALQGNGLDLLTATNNGGNANVGIGNDASAGYALDVTGTGRFSGSVVATGGIQTSTIDTASAGALSIGSTNATSVNIAKNTTITGQSGSQALTINQVGTSSIMQLQHNGTNVLNVANNGGVAIQLDSATNSDFAVVNQSGTNVFNIDTSNGYTVDNGTTSPDNLLENPGFESNGRFQSSGWTNTDAALTIGTTNPHSGSRSLAVPAIGAINATKATKWYTAEPGEIFYGEVWARIASGTNGTAAMQISYYDASKTFLSFSSVSMTGSTTYTKYTLNGTAPANTAYVTISPRATADSTTGTWYFDDLYFAKASQKQSLKLQDASGTTQVSLDNATGAIQGSSLDTTAAGALSIGSANATSVTLGNATTTRTNTLFGQTIIKSSSDGNNAMAFQIQRADGTSMFTADSLAQTITIGNAISGDKMVISTENGQVVYYGSARRTKKITLNAEYTSSVLDAGTGSNNSGIMTSSTDLTNRMNYYKWTTSQSTNQTYDIVVQVPIPTDFDGWASSNPLSVASYTSDTTNGTIKLEARDSTNAVRCDFVGVTPSSTNTWSTNTTACTLDSGTYTGGDYMTLRIRMQSPNGGNVRVGSINLSYLSKY